MGVEEIFDDIEKLKTVVYYDLKTIREISDELKQTHEKMLHEHVQLLEREKELAKKIYSTGEDIATALKLINNNVNQLKSQFEEEIKAREELISQLAKQKKIFVDITKEFVNANESLIQEVRNLEKRFENYKEEANKTRKKVENVEFLLYIVIALLIISTVATTFWR